MQGAQVLDSGELQPQSQTADDNQSPADDGNAIEAEADATATAENPVTGGTIENADNPEESNCYGVPDTDEEEALPRTASRVARPDSAQIAQLIEGYDDDFLDEEAGPAELYPEPEVFSLKHYILPHSGKSMDGLRNHCTSLSPFW